MHKAQYSKEKDFIEKKKEAESQKTDIFTSRLSGYVF